MRNNLLGIIFSFILAAIAWYTAPFIPYVNGVLFALIVGILLANFRVLPASSAEGIGFSSKKILEWAIIFMGFGIQFSEIASAGLNPLIVIIAVIIVSLLFGAWQSKKFPSDTVANELITFGTAICGTSAVAALAPKINATKNCVGVSIAVVNLYGLVGMIVLPLVLVYLLPEQQLALILGSTLHGVGNVTGAGYSISTEVGNLALTFKLTRVALLAPALILFGSLLHSKSTGKSAWSIPYYVIGFVVTSVIASVYSPSGDELEYAQSLGNFLMVMAMGAIGMQITFTDILAQGKSALKWGALIFVIQVVAATILAMLLV